MFQVWRWRKLFVEWVKDQQVAFSLSNLLTRSGQSRLFSPCLPLLLVPITRRSYGKFQDYCSQYSLFNQAGKHRGQKKGTQNRHLWDRTWAMNLLENPFCWTFPALIQPLTLQVMVPRWEFLQNSTLEAHGSEIGRSEGWTQGKSRNQTFPLPWRWGRPGRRPGVRREAGEALIGGRIWPFKVKEWSLSWASVWKHQGLGHRVSTLPVIFICSPQSHTCTHTSVSGLFASAASSSGEHKVTPSPSPQGPVETLILAVTLEHFGQLNYATKSF